MQRCSNLILEALTLNPKCIPDFNPHPEPYPYSACLACAGFFFSYNASSLKPKITEAAWALEADFPGEPWYVIGHSMGSALATICALDLKVSPDTIGWDWDRAGSTYTALHDVCGQGQLQSHVSQELRAL